jgi:transcriptional regulator with XRE-family HTH domain
MSPSSRSPAPQPPRAPGPFGRTLRQWRQARGKSQLSLALAAETSTRHLSFLETGRAQPSRSMVLRLCEALEVPLRERNALLATAGFAALYRESDLSSPEMAQLRKVLRFLLERHEPFPAALVDRAGRVLDANAASTRVLGRFAGPGAVWREQPPNLLRLTVHPEGLRPFLVNFADVATALLRRLQREAAAAGPGDALHALVEELLALPELPAGATDAPLARALDPVLPVHLKRDGLELRLFSTLTTVGTPQDVTLEELRIESFMPADAASEDALRRLAGEAQAPAARPG